MAQNRESWSENKLITDSPLAMRWIVSPISGATETWRIFEQARALSDAARGCSKIRQLTVAPLIAETIQRIAKGESVMSLFSDQENLF
jgi:hypothetical protein